MSNSDKLSLIEPDKADLLIQVAPEGVFMGFFPKHGPMQFVNLEKVPALAAWVIDRRRQAGIAKAVDNER